MQIHTYIHICSYAHSHLHGLMIGNKHWFVVRLQTPPSQDSRGWALRTGKKALFFNRLLHLRKGEEQRLCMGGELMCILFLPMEQIPNNRCLQMGFSFFWRRLSFAYVLFKQTAHIRHPGK